MVFYKSSSIALYLNFKLLEVWNKQYKIWFNLRAWDSSFLERLAQDQNLARLSGINNLGNFLEKSCEC